MDHSSDGSMKRTPIKVEKAAECPEHGPYLSCQLVPRIWSKCPACVDDEAAAEDRAESERAEREAEARHRDALATARIPARFVRRSFKSFVATTDAQRYARSTVREYVDGFADNAHRGRGLVLAGMPGTGKTHLATAALQSVITKKVCYVTCLDLIREVRDTWRRDSERSATTVLAYLERLDLLVIDEVGVQYGTIGEQTTLFEVLDRRYREKRPTILLTNQDREGFKTFIGERGFDRIVETSRWIPFDWPSYRPTVRK